MKSDDNAAKVLTAVDELSTKVDSLNTNFDSLNTKFDSLNTKFDSLSGEVGSLSNEVGSLSYEVRTMSGSLTSLTRTVDRIDHRLVEVEKHTALIPGMAEALGAHSVDLDNHEKRIIKLEEASAD